MQDLGVKLKREILSLFYTNFYSYSMRLKWEEK